MQDDTAAVERVFREEYGRLIATLVRRFGDIDIAEEAAGEALVTALEKWPESGVPPNPGGWLTTTAGNRAIDRIRREKQRDAKHQAAIMVYDDTPPEPTGAVEDDRLRLVFTCCHPALATEARIALTLRLLGGLTVAEIAQAFLVPETTMGQRITRAKKKIAAANVPYRVPESADLPAAAQRRAGRAVPRLQRGLPRQRRRRSDPGRTDGRGDPADADPAPAVAGRARGDRPARADGADRGAARGPGAQRAARPARRAGPRRLGSRADRRGPRSRPRVPGDQPTRVATRSSPRSTPSTPTRRPRPTRIGRRWSPSTTSSTRLDPSPIVALNRAVAVAELDGPEVALALVDRLPLAGVPRLARRSRRSAAPARPKRRGEGGLRRRDRRDPELGRAGLPGPKAR